MTLQLCFGEATATGPRAENQDAIRIVTPQPALAASKGQLFAIADGVSACVDGGLAARATLQALALDYYSTPETWSVLQALERLLLAQNRWLLANGGGQPLLTTLSALVLRGRRFTLAHVGDCRVYRKRGERLERLSEDHVWAQPGMQHVLKRAMGLDHHLVVDYLEGDVAQDDVFVLVSDGVWSSLDDTGIQAILRDEPDLSLAAGALVRAAHLAGSQDNASALLARVEALPQGNLADALAQSVQWAATPPLRTGQTFEGWQVDALLRTSRQSRLYRVFDENRHPWLLKTLPLGVEDEPAAQALLLEEWFLRRVAGRHFPEVHPAPRRQHQYFLQREYAGRNLANLPPLPLPEWLDIAARLIRALGLLHRRNILHRDIKPENLHRDDHGELRILDFGLAYCPGLSSDAAGTLPGTPSFIAPEAFAGVAPAPQQDLYAAGVTLYLLLTGHYPYGEIEPFQHPRFGRPTAPSRYRPDLPVWIEEWLLRAIAADPQQRFETAEEWLLVLERGERQSLPARPTPLLQREPLKLWRGLALTSLVLNLILLYALLM